MNGSLKESLEKLHQALEVTRDFGARQSILKRIWKLEHSRNGTTRNGEQATKRKAEASKRARTLAEAG
jgi:hypothetical protein